MAKKNLVTYGLIAAGVVAAVILIRNMNKRKKSSVFADSPIKQTEEEFYAEREEVEKKPSILETAGTLIKTIFPKKTAEQKAARKTAKAQKKKLRKSSTAVRKGVMAVQKASASPFASFAGIDDAEVLC